MTKMKNNLAGFLVLVFGLTVGNLLTNSIVTLMEPSTEKYEIIEVLPKSERPDFKVTSQDYGPNRYSPAVLLKVKPDPVHNPNGNHCSGTVISNEYVLTAAHCLQDDDGHLMKSIIIKNAIPAVDGLDSTQDGIPVGINKRADYGLVRGNFTLFKKSIIDVTMTTAMLGNNPMSLCGSGYGSGFTCYPILKRMMCDLKICFPGAITVPGMSGGPVIMESQYGPIQFAVNYGYGEYAAKASPLVGLFESLGIDVAK